MYAASNSVDICFFQMIKLLLTHYVHTLAIYDTMSSKMVLRAFNRLALAVTCHSHARDYQMGL